MTLPTHPQTAAVRTGLESDAQHGAVVPPLHLSSNYTFAGFGAPRTYDYTRSGNPTRDALADTLTALEGGAGASVTASGMAAITLACQLLSPGDTLVAPHDCYGGTFRLFRTLAGKGQFKLRFVDQTDLDALARSLDDSVRLIWVETPSNPLLRVVDIAAVVRLARSHGALVGVDNTFLSPALQQPLSLGADFVVHSTTKYLNGHSDVVGGAVVAAEQGLADELRDWSNNLGLTGAPFDAYLTLRGVRSLHARMRTHEENAATLAASLAADERVAAVYYPGLANSPYFDLASRQQRGFGGMVSVEFDTACVCIRTFAENLSHFSLAESLGGVESLVCHPSSMTHAPLSAEDKASAGISEGLIRLSVGIERCEDLVADIRSTLDRATRVRSPELRVAGALQATIRQRKERLRA